MKITITLVILSVALLTIQTRGQSSWDLYQPRTFEEFNAKIIPKSLKGPDVVITDPQKKPQIVLSYNSFQSQIKLRYIGDSRKVSDKRKEVIDLWLKTLGKDKSLLDLFENEYLFLENKTEYWLPVQKQVAAYFPKELKKNDTITALVIWLGGRYTGTTFDPVFLMNEFENE